ncbi:unnamed protein product [Clonostachys solani]|uniref:F-box domain-containing protein n=1 Tax=Clonostachys solani TaxID=160281 RepID=A0A9N9ZGD3_9HYPO|nr:unnamed protein product [Clonostachys solani]
MATFPRLPKEVIVEVLSYLSYDTLESLAWTLKHPITEISISLLQPIFKSRRDTKRLIERLGPLQTQSFNALRQDFIEGPEFLECLGLSPQTVVKLPPDSQLPNLDYLHLCGDFKWLEPLTGILAEITESKYAGPAVRDSSYDDLISSADRIGVTLPPAFLKFIQDEKLQRRMPSAGDYFCLELGGLRKVPKSLDGGVGGYKIIFLSEHEGAYLFSLYIEPGKKGASCVLQEFRPGHWGYECHHQHERGDGGNPDCPNITDQDRQDAKEMGVDIVNNPCADFSLVGVDFETWLATRYYRESLWHSVSSTAGDVPGLKEYVKRELIQ